MPDPLLRLALAGLLPILVLALLTWLASLQRRDASLVDRIWPLAIAGAACTYVWLGPPPGARSLWMAALLAAWGLRLGVYLTLRNWGHGEDRRYREIRIRNQPGFGFKSLYLVFGLQALLAWIVSLPALVVAFGAGRPPGWLDLAGGLLMAFGIVFEAVADAQMRRFKADPGHAGQVLDRGLWQLTRHPNYFGECCVWWGLWLLALAAAGPGGAWSVISPLLMTFLLLRVSGVNLLEKDIAERRPAYRDYIARTNAFVPGWPKPSRSPPATP
jgi:steroid 5-alpha reductase family enzyme